MNHKKTHLLKQWQTQLLSLIVAVTLPLNSLIFSSKKEEDSNSNSTTMEKNLTQEQLNLLKKLNQESSKLEETEMTLEEKNNFITLISDLNPTYHWEEYYLSSDKVKDLIEKSENQSKNNSNCHYVYDGKLNQIIDKIEQNSNTYALIHPEYQSMFEDKELKNDQTFKEILSQVLNDIIETATNDINEDLCQISSLIIVSKPSNHKDIGNYNEQENRIILNPKKIAEYEEKYNVKNYLEDVIVHEINHSRQFPCSCQTSNFEEESTLEYEQIFNKDYCTPFYIETSAESAIYNLNQNQSFQSKNIEQENTINSIYEEEKKEESLLLTLSLYQPNQSIENYYNAIFDNDFKSFCAFFGANTKEEIYNLYKIIYAIDGREFRNFLSIKIYASKILNLQLLDCKEKEAEIGYAYRTDIFKTNINNLIEYTYNHEDFTIYENLILFNIIKCLVATGDYNEEQSLQDSNYNLSKDNSAKYDIYFLENTYLSFLSQYYNVTEKDLKEQEIGITEIIIPNMVEIIQKNHCSEGTDDILSSELTKVEKNLLKRFPLIENILLGNPISGNEYYNFLEEGNLINLSDNIKKKTRN